MSNESTPEKIALHYNAMLDSVNLINSLVPTQNIKELEIVDRNVRHLELMVQRDWWSKYDLAPINAAILAGKQ
jgi:hypothetical protein